MKQTNTFTVKYAMFARQNMLFVKNTKVKDFLLISLFLLFESGLMANTYYVATDGLDSNPGTKDKPWATWGKAFTSTSVIAGDTVYFRGGVYPMSILDGTGYFITRLGTEEAYIYYMNYPGEAPILDCKNVVPSGRTNRAITINVPPAGNDYVKLKGLTIRNVLQVEGRQVGAQGFRAIEGNIIFENCTAYNIHGTGFYSAWNGINDSHHYYINCDAHDICDSLTVADDPENPMLVGNIGSGFNTHNFVNTLGHVHYINCRAWHCSDQGFGAMDPITEYIGCWSFANGALDGDGIGWKLGWVNFSSDAVRRILNNCIAAYNRYTGITTNDYGQDAVCKMQIYNNTIYKNGWAPFVYSRGIYVENSLLADEEELSRIFKNNISYDNQYGAIYVQTNALYNHDHNNWDIPLILTDADFISVDSTGLAGPRQVDGSLPDLNGFLKLKAGSKAIDAGVDVGLPYSGKAPDLGAYEYDPEEGMNQYPVISITSPASGNVFTTPAIITIITEASDPDGSVKIVEFYNGSVKIGEKTSAPWSFTWSNVPEGTYTISAVATDDLNAKTPSAPVKITVNQPPPVINQPPSVSITNPVAGSVFTAPATISISADATDADGLVSRVEFFNGTTKLGERTSKPWSYTWNNVAPGNYTITAVATDNASAKTTSAAVIITVNAYPEVSINSPVSGSNFNAPGNITIVAEASDDDGTIENVEFFNGATSLSVIKSAPWEAIWNNISPGSYTIKAVATDNSGLKTESNIVDITVSDSPFTLNQPPVIYISSVEPESLYAPTNITITAGASDLDGFVSSVEFFNGSKSLGIKSAPPWIMEWGDVPAGTYYLSATATDNLGSETKSSAFAVTINELPNQPPVVSIVSPADRQVFENNDEIIITIAASDPDGSIERIELYDGSELFVEISSFPYTYYWKYAREGIHIINAVAVDNLNESTISSPVSIEVKTGQNEPEEENENGLDLYPNPNDGNFTVAFTGADPDGLGMIDIVSADGKSIKREILGSENITKTFNLSRIKSGVYILIYRNKGRIISTRKFIKN